MNSIMKDVYTIMIACNYRRYGEWAYFTIDETNFSIKLGQYKHLFKHMKFISKYARKE